jgi:hypothetical protein
MGFLARAKELANFEELKFGQGKINNFKAYEKFGHQNGHTNGESQKQSDEHKTKKMDGGH